MKASKKRKTTFAIILLVAIISLVARILLFPHFTLEQHALSFVWAFFVILFIWEAIKYIHYSLNKSFPFERGVVRRIIVQIGVGLIFIYAIRFCLFCFLVDKLPVKLDKSLKIAAFFLDTLVVLAINIGYFASHFFQEWKKSLLRSERLLRERTQVQFENLKNQLNPHFLFNSLTSLNSLIYENQDLASSFLKNLSKVYRYMLQNKEKNIVLLKTEIQFIENYIFLLQTRFGKSLQICFAINQEAREKYIVPVTLQILIENAIKHNVLSETRPLIITIKDEPEYLVIENNLQRKNIVDSSNKIGLENMKSLYSFLSKNPFIIEESNDTFKIKIPFVNIP